MSSIFRFVACLVFLSCRTTNCVEIQASSDIGQKLLSSARRLENGGNNQNNNNNNNNSNSNYYWIANYSLKFLGCHNIQSWNYAAYDDDDVRIKQSRLARFRLCPSNFCSTGNSVGCKKGYGDYVIDIDTYVSAYVEAQRRQDEYLCERFLSRRCDCQQDGQNDGSFDRDMCVYKCFAKAKKWDCIETNPYYDDDASTHLYRNDLRDFEKYFQGCSQFKASYSHQGRKLDENGNDIYETYYIGSYCADQGGKIYLGMFTDDTCTIFADKNAGRTTYKQITGGMELPFSKVSMVRPDCVSCNERDHEEYQQQNGNNNPNDDNQNQVRILGSCKDVYKAAGKCETHMGSKNGYARPYAINENACYYLEGIKLVRRDGIINTSLTRPNKVVSFFIFLFSVSFTLLGAFIYYLRMSKYGIFDFRDPSMDSLFIHCVNEKL
mmetsp:Transcript_17066/g.32284  ORF Transcript_17066/g.32284 Transcript_17066/m.32284 type:complete len:436 (-) Transcript_17066:248-1555(-)